MQIVFFGAGKIAALLLQRLSEAHDMMLTVTPPPRPAGRKMIKQQCPAAGCATRLNLPLHETAATRRCSGPIRQNAARIGCRLRLWFIAAAKHSKLVADGGIKYASFFIAAMARGGAD